MGGPEGVVHVDLGQGGEPVGQLGGVLLLAGLVAEVLEQQDLAVAEASAAWRAWSPATSSTNATSTPRCSARTGRTGSSEYVGSRLPLGRPRWEQQITWPPWSSSHRRVGTAARTRRSSVTFPSSRGTLKSLRTRTRLPATSAWSTVRSSTGLELLADQHGQVDEPLGVAPLVVVPAEHLGQAAVGLGQGESKMQEASSPTMSRDTIGSVE